MNLTRDNTGFDRRKNLEITSIWDLPLGRGKNWLANKGAISQIVSGWQVNNVVSVIGGPPFNVWGDCDPHWPGSYLPMVDIVGKPHRIGSSSGFWYDPSGFAEVFDPSKSDGSCLSPLGKFRLNKP